MTEMQESVGPLVGMWKLGAALSRSDVIPKAYRGNEGNCFVAVDIAQRMGVSVFEVMQSLNVIQGQPSWGAAYCIAMANQRGPFVGPISYDIDSSDPNNLSVRAWAKVRETGIEVSATVDMRTAAAEGWTRNTKYQTIPEQMLCFRSATFLVRRYCPEVLLGMQTSEEVEDVGARSADYVVTDGRAAGIEDMVSALASREEGTAPAPQVEEEAPEGPPAETQVPVPDGDPDEASRAEALDAFLFNEPG